MENNFKHFFFDGYDYNEQELSSVNNMEALINTINQKYFNSQGIIKIIPYFNGKVPADGGVSGTILGQNSHFTCHTFCYQKTLFIDYFGPLANHEKVKADILAVYPTSDYDLCTNNQNLIGNFGKHIIVEKDNPFTYLEALNLIKKILIDIEMTPICDTITRKTDDTNFDMLQVIAESHISIHQAANKTAIDTFSCKYFDEQKLLALLGTNDYQEIIRGVKYKQKRP